jgi:site-specific recombinase XerD
MATVKDVRGDVAQVTEDSEPEAPVGRQMTDGELRGLLEACAGQVTSANVRDTAILSLMWATGMRRGELWGMRMADLHERKADSLMIRIRGKGAKARKLPVTNGAFHYLARWLEIRGGDPGAVFKVITKGDRMQARGISEDGMARMLTKRLGQAGIVEPTTWHDFRRTFASNLLQRGVDLVTVQRLMGHTSPVTTGAYDRRDERTRDVALETIHIPYLWK